ncbi:MAG: hypothetical protein ACFFDG_11960 [Promethearchaeota archaeon]
MYAIYGMLKLSTGKVRISSMIRGMIVPIIKNIKACFEDFQKVEYIAYRTKTSTIIKAIPIIRMYSEIKYAR